MKISLLSLAIVGAAWATVASPSLRADDTTNLAAPAPGSTAGADSGDTGDSATPVKKHHGRFKAALAQLNLSDAQKAQIRQIHATVTDRRERRRQIMAVLSQDQRTQLKALLHRHEAANTAATPSAN